MTKEMIAARKVLKAKGCQIIYEDDDNLIIVFEDKREHDNNIVFAKVLTKRTNKNTISIVDELEDYAIWFLGKKAEKIGYEFDDTRIYLDTIMIAVLDNNKAFVITNQNIQRSNKEKDISEKSIDYQKGFARAKWVHKMFSLYDVDHDSAAYTAGESYDFCKGYFDYLDQQLALEKEE